MKPYTVMVEIARGDSTSNPFDVFFSDQEYLLRQEDGYLSARLSWGSQLQEDLIELCQSSPERGVVQRLGDTLSTFLGQLGWAAHEARITQALREGREVHITFRFAAAELYSLPWELVTLRGSGQHLGELAGCHLRYEWPGVTASGNHDATRGEGGRILFAWSAAGGMVPADEHLRALREVCARNGYAFDPDRDVLNGVSLRSLAAALEASAEPVSALHILCHGSRSPTQEYGLQWNASEGNGSVFVDPGDLRQTLAPHAGSLRMVVLCACQSGNSAPNSHLGSVAQALHRVGIPAVVASRMPFTAKGSVHLTETLYEELLGRLSPLSQALAAARSRLQEDAEHLDWASLQLYARAEDELCQRPFLVRPYRGLLAFGPKDRRFFFGRAKLEAQLWARVQQAAKGQRARFQVVAGASGVGKSSVVMAGLVPLLPEQEWDWWVLRPGELVRGRPRTSGERSMALHELRQRLHQVWALEPLPASGGASQQEVLEEARRLRQARPERKLLLVMDQFEEVFTQFESEECQAFVRGVWALARQPELECVVVATMRVDLFDRCGEVVLENGRRLDAVVYDEEHRTFVAQMGQEELAEAIEQPARKVGLELEAGLVDRLLGDVGQEPGALPLLEHALDLLWQKREGRWLTHRVYEELGGVAGSLTQTAERLYEELGEAERQQVRRLLVRLVAARDMGSPRAQGRVWVEELRPQEEEGRAFFDSALEQLVGHRLLVQGGSSEGGGGERGAWVQLAHETLLRRWKRLERWVAEDWEREQQLRELEEWAEDWEAHRGHADGGASYLLLGDRLRYARSLREKHAGELSPRSQRLLEESLAAEERQQRQERETKQVIASAQARAERFFRGAFGVTAVLLVGAIAAVFIFSDLRQQERELRKAGLRMARVLLAQQFLRQDPTRGLLLLRETEDDERDPKWVGAAIDILQQPVAKTVLRGHGGRVSSALFSPEGDRVLTASEDGTARVWSVQGKLLASLEGHGGAVVSAAFDQNGSQVVTASEDRKVRVWSVQGKLLATLEGHEQAVRSVAFSPNGDRVVTASEDWTARVWNSQGGLVATLNPYSSVFSAVFNGWGDRVALTLDNGAEVWSPQGKRLATLDELNGRVQSAAFHPDGERVVTTRGSKARVWSGVGQLLSTLEGHDGKVLSAVFSRNGQWVVTASEDGTARLWDEEGRQLAKLEGHEGPVLAAAFSPDSTRVVTASGDGVALIWSVQGKLLARLVGHGSQVLSVDFSPDGQQVVTASADKTARVWNTEGLLSVAQLEGHDGPVLSVAFSPDGQSVLTGSKDGSVRFWNLQGRKVRDLSLYHAVLSAAFSPDGQQVVTASAGGAVQVWGAKEEDSGEELAKLEGNGAPVRQVSFSPDGQHVLTASEDGTARIWTPGGQLRLTLEGHTGKVLSAAFSLDGQQVVTASEDGTARVWSARGALVTTLPARGGRGYSAAFSPHGGRVVTASEDGTARVWDTQGTLLATLTGHKGAVYSASFSPDGLRVLTASEDGTARVWGAQGGLLATLPGSGGGVLSAAFSPDGEWVAVGASDGRVRLWPISIRLLKEQMERATHECLGVEERQVYLNETPEEARTGSEHCQTAYAHGAADGKASDHEAGEMTP